ncbi:PAS domain S-box protein [Methanoplanus endosymbiosus]|uniref:PAS domain S-box protein n=1 Tax=Methanoplanus endosymbiosus TaxID=33865 RepID=A0A9E7PR04_9EURY|nr:PAS domain S-box protein [Methanoplanus endosymbiosus]UUX93276.1 PAS domain S-box protein [Methanoplanus endosymbiosus]
MNERTAADILAENEDLKARLEETEEVLLAIRAGEVDAIVGMPDTGGKIYTLKGAETPYRHFIETISEGAVTLSSDGTLLYGNRGFAEIIRLPPEKILGSAFPDLVADSDREMVAAMLSTAIKRPVSGELNLKVTSETGTEPVPVQLSLSRISGDDSETIGGIITDLTFRKQTEDVIRSELLARSVFEQAGEAIVVINPEGIVIRSNAVANRLAGTYPVFQPFTTVFPVIPSGNRTAESLIQALLSGSTFRGVEVHLAGGDSAGFDLLFSGSPLRNETGEIPGSVIVLSDITVQKASAEHILYLNKVLLTTRNVNRLLVRERDPDQLLQEVCIILGENRGFEDAWIVRFDENGAFLKLYSSGLGMISADLNSFLREGNIPWCLGEAVKREGVLPVEKLSEKCKTCPLFGLCAGRITLTCPLRYEKEIYGVLSVILPEKVILGKEDPDLFDEVCNDVSFGLHTIGLEEREKRALAQIQRNMMQLATLNDEVRNPLAIIRILNEFENTESNRKIIDEQICLINDLITKLDVGWVDSEKIWSYLMKHHGIKKQDEDK